MNQVMRVFSKTGTSGHPIQRIQCRDRFLSALLTELGDRCALGDGYVEIDAASRADLSIVGEIAERCGVEFSYAVENALSASEFKRAFLVRLGIQGEPVDEDEDGQGLNSYQLLSCASCRMPKELPLPEPYVVSRSRVIDQSARWGEAPPSLDREVFTGSMGVFVVVSRVKEILDRVICGQVKCSPVVFEDAESAGGGSLWAVRPIVNWGIRIGREERARCSRCWTVTEARLNTDGSSPFDDARHAVASEPLPNVDIVCADGWFGNRREMPFGYMRDVYVSGRLYALLRGTKVRGLSRPADVVWVGDDVPMMGAKEVSNWMRDSKAALESSSARDS